MQFMLEESLEDVYVKYYQNTRNSHLDKDEFDDIIRIDPTFEADKDTLGKYGKWLLQLRNHLNKSFDDHTSSELNDQLDIFNKGKSGYDLADRDIGKIKSLDQLIALNHKYDAKNSSVQSLKAASVPGVELIGQSANWEVYRPTTHAASKYLRCDNASWCTGRVNDSSYFNSYNRSSILIIFINKANRDEKYQGAFNKTTYKCSEFKDAKNVPANFVQFYTTNTDIANIIRKSAYKEIDTEMQEEIEKEKIRINFFNDFWSKMIDGILTVDGAVLSMIDNELFRENLPTKADFEEHKLTGIKLMSSSRDNISNTIRALFTRYDMQSAEFLNKVEIYLPEDISDISDDVQLLIRFKHIWISKKTRFSCYDWQKALLKPVIIWY